MQEEEPYCLKLEWLAGPRQGVSLIEPGKTLTVGRTKTSKICVKDPSVSEKHAKLEWRDFAWLLQDLGSTNGTAVNGISLASKDEGVALREGDIVQFGDTTKLRVEILPVYTESITVEQFMEAEITRFCDRIKANLEQQASLLREECNNDQEELLAQYWQKRET